MCSLPSSPPLPLQFPQNAREVQDQNHSSELEEDVRIRSALLNWIGHPEPSKPFLTAWKTPPTILQDGPQCGLVALAMGAQMLGYDVHPASLLYEGKALNLTKQGEIFSATWMCILARKAGIQITLLDEGLKEHSAVLNYLIQGKPLLVPYDADFNHLPCKKKGHKAHWALIIGFIMPSPFFHSSIWNGNCIAPESNIRRITKSEDWNSHNIKKSNLFLLAKQGKSRHLGIWNYTELEESNKNLVEVDPKRNNPEEYALPANNKLCDLNGKILLIE